MKKIIMYAAGATAMISAGAAFAGDGGEVSREIGLSGFDRIIAAGVYELNVSVGDEYSIRLSGPESEVNRVNASVKNGALVLDQDKRNRGEKKSKKRDGVEVEITMPRLVGLDISGVVDGDVSGVDVDRCDVDISGVGEVDVAGECGTLTANMSGVGELDAKDLECSNADVEVSGVGGAVVFAREEVEAKVSGIGDIDIYGAPKNVRKDKGMFAEITVH